MKDEGCRMKDEGVCVFSSNWFDEGRRLNV